MIGYEFEKYSDNFHKNRIINAKNVQQRLKNMVSELTLSKEDLAFINQALTFYIQQSNLSTKKGLIHDATRAAAKKLKTLLTLKTSSICLL